MANGNGTNKGLVWITTVLLPLAIGMGTISYAIYSLGVHQTEMCKDIESVTKFAQMIKTEGTDVSRGAQVVRAKIEMQVATVDSRLSEVQTDVKELHNMLAERAQRDRENQRKMLELLQKLSEKE